MSLEAGDFITARRPDTKRIRWRDAVVVEPAKRGTDDFVKLKFQGDTEIHALKWDHVKLPDNESKPSRNGTSTDWRGTTSTTPFLPASMVINIDATDSVPPSPPVQDPRESRGSVANTSKQGLGILQRPYGEIVAARSGSYQTQRGGNGLGGTQNSSVVDGSKSLHLLDSVQGEAFLTEDEIINKRAEERRNQLRRKEEEKRNQLRRKELERRKEIMRREREERERAAQRIARNPKEFNFADFITAKGGGIRRDAIESEPDKIEPGDSFAQKRKSNVLTIGSDIDDSARPSEKKRREKGNLKKKFRTLSEEHKQRPYQRRAEFPTSSESEMERHPMPASLQDEDYRIPRIGEKRKDRSYRGLKSSGKNGKQNRLGGGRGSALRPAQSSTDAWAPSSGDEELQCVGFIPQSTGSAKRQVPPYVPIRLNSRPKAKRIATDFTATGNPFNTVAYSAEENHVFDVCQDLLGGNYWKEVEMVTKKLAETKVVTENIKIGKGRKKAKPIQWCSLRAVAITDAELKVPHVQPTQSLKTIDSNTPGRTDALTSSRENAHVQIPLPIILRCVCNVTDPVQDLNSVLQCQVCGLWSHTRCTQQTDKMHNIRNVNLKNGFICVHCVERINLVVCPRSRISLDGEDEGHEARSGSGEVNSRPSLPVQVRTLEQMMRDLGRPPPELHVPRESASYVSDTTVKLTRRPLTEAETRAREDNVEFLRAGVLRPYVGHREERLMSTLTIKAELLRKASKKSGQEQIEDAVEIIHLDG